MEGQSPRSTRRVVAPPPPSIPMVKIGVAAGLVIAAVVGWMMFSGGSPEEDLPARPRRNRSEAKKPPAAVSAPAPSPAPAPAPAVRVSVVETPPPAPPIPEPPPPPAPAAVEAAPPKEPGVAPPTPPAVQKAREAAQERVRAAREEIAREAREVREREARLEKAFKDTTERNPLRVKLGDGLFIDQVKVTAYAGGLLKLAWPQGAVEYPIETLPEAARTALLEGALPAAAPRDRFEIGKIFLRTGDYDRSGACLARAMADDASLMPLCPDVERVRKMSRVFEGAFRVSGNDLGVSWTFRKPDEAKDFIPYEGSACAVRPESGLEISGDRLAFATVKDIPFRDRIRVAVTARDADYILHLLGIRFVRPDGRDVLIYAAFATRLRVFGIFRREDDRVIDLVPDSGYAGGNRMEMEFARGKFSFRIGQKTLWTGQEAGFTEVEVILGGIAYAKEGEKPGKACAVFREVSVSGGVNPAWMRKTLAGHREALASELARERRVRREGEKEEAEVSLALSIDALLGGAAGQAEVGTALEPVRQYLKSGEAEHYPPAAQAAEQFTGKYPGFAPGWYWRGVLAEEADRPREAARHYEKAVQCFAEFPEALSARARLFALAGDEKAARGLLDRAMAAAPDLGEAHLLAARLEHMAGRREAALESAALARKLAPNDPVLQAHAQMMGNMIRGPLWTRVNQHETAHYLLRSDLPRDKCRQYAEHLEALRALYEEGLSVPAPAGRRAEVVLFNAPEGYYSYLEVTAGSRGETTLGAFSSWYGQLVLFEDPEAEETLRVLGHEGFHQYLHGSLGGAPIWFNEGMAEYVAASKVDKGKVVERGKIQEGRLANLRLALKYGWKPVPFDQIMVESQGSFYGKGAAFKYAQAWSMVHYLLHGEKGKWAALLAAYVKRLAAGDAAPEAFAATFGKEDLRAMEAAWLAYVGTLGGGPAAAAAAPDAPVDLLAMLDLKKDAIWGGWARSGKAVVCVQKITWARLQIPYAPPAEYDLSLTIERKDGNDGFNIGLVLGPTQGLLSIDGWKSTISGIGLIDGRWADNNETTWRGTLLKNNRPSTVFCEVRKGGITVTVDGKKIISWRGDSGRLKNLQDMAVPSQEALFVGGWESVYVIHKMMLTPVSGHGVKLR